jgi:hypothetical protein
MSGNAESLWPSGQPAYVSGAEPWRILTTTGLSAARAGNGCRAILSTFAVTGLGDVTDGPNTTPMPRRKRGITFAPGKTRGVSLSSSTDVSG